MDQKKIGNLIKQLRSEKNLSQKDLAIILNITPQAISKWENGRGIPDIEILKQLSEHFNIEIKELLDGERIKKKNKNYIPYLIFIIIILLLVFNKPTIDMNKINSKEETFKITGIVATEKSKSKIYISSVIYQKQELEKFTKIEIDLIEQNKNNIQIIAKYQNKLEGTLEDLLKEVELDTIYTCKNIKDHQLYLLINATSLDNKVHAYKIPLEIEEKCLK